MRLSARGVGALAACAGGALPAAAFPEPGLWWLAFCGLVPWLLVLRAAPSGRDAALRGWLGGTGLMLATHHWLAAHLHVFLLVLCAVIGALWAVWGWLAHRLLRPGPHGTRRSLTALAVLPSAWLLAELVRSWEHLGGPWGLLGASQWQVSSSLRLMSLGGVWLVSLALVLVNVALTLVVVGGRRLPRHGGARQAGVGLGALGAAGAVWATGAWVVPTPPPTGTANIALVQPGIVAGAQNRFDRGVELTRALPRDGLDLVVWGESSVGFAPSARPEAPRVLRSLAAEHGADLLVNVDARHGEGAGIFKSSVLVGHDGLAGERYDKMRLVPFGEYVPARPLLGWVTSVGRAAQEDRRRGAEQQVLDADGLRVGPLICFETAFPDMARQLTADGAQVLVAQSSTSTFQDSWAPAQHASLAALRAAESGRPVVHATLTGVSAVFGPAGEPVGPKLGTETSTAQVREVPLADTQTPYTRYGDWAVGLALAVLTGMTVFALLSRRPTARR